MSAGRLLNGIRGTQIALSAILWLAAAVLGFLFVRAVIRDASTSTNDFAAYFVSAVLVVEGEPVSKLYDDEWFALQTTERTGHRVIFDVNSPLVPFVFRFFVPLGEIGARRVWSTLSACCLIGFSIWALRTLALPGFWLPLGFFLLFGFDPLWRCFHQAQAYAILLGGCVLAWTHYRRNNERRVGIIVGAMCVFKPAVPGLVIALVAGRMWRSFGWLVAAAGLLVAASLPLVGVDAWAAFIREIAEAAGRPMNGHAAYQSLNGFLLHHLTLHPKWHPAPILNSLPVARAIFILLAAGILGVSIGRVAGAAASRRGSAFSSCLLAGVILTPLSIDYHFTLTLLPIALLFAELQGSRSLLSWTAFIVGSMLIAAPIPYESLRFSSGSLAWLAYPKLFGATILWLLSVRLSRSSQKKCVAS